MQTHLALFYRLRNCAYLWQNTNLAELLMISCIHEVKMVPFKT